MAQPITTMSPDVDEVLKVLKVKVDELDRMITEMDEESTLLSQSWTKQKLEEGVVNYYNLYNLHL